MATIAILSIIAGMFYCLATSVLGYMSYASTHDWHHGVGATLYAVATVLLATCLF